MGSREKTVVNDVQLLPMVLTVCRYVTVVMINVTMHMDAYVHYQVISLSGLLTFDLDIIIIYFPNLSYRLRFQMMIFKHVFIIKTNFTLKNVRSEE